MSHKRKYTNIRVNNCYLSGLQVEMNILRVWADDLVKSLHIIAI